MNSLSTVITTLMQDKGLTEGKLAKLSGVNQPTLHRIKNGHVKSPAGHTVDKLAKALGVTPAQLRGEVSIPNINGLNIITSQEKYEAIPGAQQHLVNEMIDQLYSVSKVDQ